MKDYEATIVFLLLGFLIGMSIMTNRTVQIIEEKAAYIVELEEECR